MQKAASFRARSSRRGSVSPQAGNLDRMASRRSFALTDEGRRESRGRDDFDHVSETSSMEERRYADLLGSDSDSDNGGGIAIDNIGHRLYLTGTMREKVKQERLQMLREKVLLKELTEVTTKPSVTNHARWKPAKGAMFAEHAIEWQEQRQRKLDESALKIRAEEERELMPSPHINRRSADIAASKGYLGPIQGWEDHFAKYCAKKAAQQNQVHPPGMFTPNINKSRDLDESRAQEGVPIGDRLFEDSYARSDRQREMEEYHREREMIDEFTNRPLFEPSRVEYPLPEGRDVNETPEASGSRLHSLHAARMERKRQAQEATAELSCRFSPKVNAKSQEIGERRRKPLYHNKVDYHKLQLEAEDRDRAMGISSFHPSTSSTPRGGAAPVVRQQRPTAASARDFVNRNERLNLQRQARLAKIKEEAMEHQSRECTFQPSVNRRSMELFHNINQYGTELLEAPSLKYQSVGGGVDLNNSRGSINNGSGMLNSTNNNLAASAGLQGFGSPMPNKYQHQYADPRATAESIQRGSTSAYHNNPNSNQKLNTSSSYPRSPSAINQATPGKSQSHRHHQHGPSPAASERYNLSGATGGGGGGAVVGGADGGQQKNELNEYVQSFERQMFQVLDEWRRLEDV